MWKKNKNKNEVNSLVDLSLLFLAPAILFIALIVEYAWDYGLDDEPPTSLVMLEYHTPNIPSAVLCFIYIFLYWQKELN